MKIYVTPTLSNLTFVNDDILSISTDLESTFNGVAEGGKGSGTEIDFSDLLN